MMRYFIDTEFIESGPGHPVWLLSIGIAAEDGRNLYLEVRDAPVELANDWVKANVLPHLGKRGGAHRCTLQGIASAIREFVGADRPEFWGYYADYDWVVFCQIFGCMVDLPKGWPMYCRDIKQLCDDIGNPPLPDHGHCEHDAMNDAMWNREVFGKLRIAEAEGIIQ